MSGDRAVNFIAALGSGSSSYEQIKAMVKDGVRIFRLNTRQSTHEDIAEIYSHIRRIEKDLGSKVFIIGDFEKPKSQSELSKKASML